MPVLQTGRVRDSREGYRVLCVIIGFIEEGEV